VHYGTESVAEGNSTVYLNALDVKGLTERQVCSLPSDVYYVAVKAYRATGVSSPYSTEKNVTITAPDNTAPTVTLAYPAPGALDVPQNIKVFLLLSDVQSGVDTTSVSIRVGNRTPVSVAFNGDKYRVGAVCEMGEPLPASSVVSVDVTVSDTARPPNTTTRSWSFTTGNTTDTTPPVFVSHSPADGAEGVSATAAVVVEIEDDTAVDPDRVQLFINGEETSVEIEDAGGGRIAARRSATAPLPLGKVDVRAVAHDLADNRTELLFDFTVGEATTVAAAPGEIVPDGYWADDPDRPLEVRNLPMGWTVRIFNTAGTQVRTFENTEEDGMTWLWDFHNDHGQEVARALYLVRVVDDAGHVQSSGKFVVRLTQ
jgi:hypothetical protein